jgi:hypothetical protein
VLIPYSHTSLLSVPQHFLESFSSHTNGYPSSPLLCFIFPSFP